LSAKSNSSGHGKREMQKNIPNFFLIGPMKCGTTAVAAALSSHPDIFMSDPKEPNYFAYQGGNPYEWEPRGKDSLEWYLGLFQNAHARKVLGDASPYYISLHHCAEEIQKFNSDAKIVAILRNPVLRAFSAYRFWHTNSGLPASADDFVDCFHGEKLRRHAERDREVRVGWLKDIGNYGKHLQRYFDVFPRDQIKVVFYHELVNDPQSFYKSVYGHLDVASSEEILPENREVNPTIERRYRRLHRLLNRGYHGAVSDSLKRTKLGAVLRGVRAAVNRTNIKPKSKTIKFPSDRYGELIAAYKDDIALLEDMLGADLEGWRNNTML
jgi:hypothetical protein